VNNALDVIDKLVGGEIVAVPKTVVDEIKVYIVKFFVACYVADCAVFVAAEAG